MKTPEEIKKGLESCGADECHGEHTGCPYKDDVFCIMHICGDALAYITQLEARGPKWISVKDRLPEPKVDVILIAKGWNDRQVYIGRLDEVKPSKSWLTGLTSNGSQWTVWGFSYLKEPIVTHWMPLPDMTKEDEQHE